MIGTTTAILGAAALGTAGSLAGGMMQADAAGKAAKSQEKAAQQSIQFQRDTATQARIDAYPWLLGGANAFYMLMDELGIPRPETPILPDLTTGPLAYNPAGTVTTAQASTSPTPAANGPITKDYAEGQGAGYLPGAARSETATTTGTASGGSGYNALGSPYSMPMTAAKGFRETPGYQFRVEEGEKGVLGNLNSLGMKNSGAALKALTRFRQGLADQEYGNWLNRIASIAGMGQSQVNTTNSLSQTAATNIGQGYQDMGAARASGYVGQANAWSNALGGITNNIGNALGQASYGSNYFPPAPGGGLW